MTGEGIQRINSNQDGQVEEDDIEESIKEEILESHGNTGNENTAHNTNHG